MLDERAVALRLAGLGEVPGAAGPASVEQGQSERLAAPALEAQQHRLGEALLSEAADPGPAAEGGCAGCPRLQRLPFAAQRRPVAREVGADCRVGVGHAGPR